MPEGPSIVILKEEVNALRLEGKKILLAEGNSKIDKERLTGQRVMAFRSWGKHFLVCFETFTLRIHFLLFGTYRINERKDSPVRLRLSFKGAELNFYTCSVKLIDQMADDAYDWTKDVMSDQWDAKKALKRLKDKPEMPACDALLDQDIFAGSGNIIKNEVLFRIKVHPLSKIGSLPLPKLREMVREVRKYSFEFLEWKKAFTLRQHWQAHTRQVCPRCHLPFIKEYLGKTQRRSFFCTNCQKLYQ